jgi:hypothetical protein
MSTQPASQCDDEIFILYARNSLLLTILTFYYCLNHFFQPYIQIYIKIRNTLIFYMHNCIIMGRKTFINTRIIFVYKNYL